MTEFIVLTDKESGNKMLVNVNKIVCFMGEGPSLVMFSNHQHGNPMWSVKESASTINELTTTYPV